MSTLPTFLTAGGQLTEPIDVDGIRHGFALREVDDFVDDLHYHHRETGRWILVQSGIADPNIEGEFEGTGAFSDYTQPHVDGLVGQYTQVHTTENDGSGAHTHLTIGQYHVSSEEHLALQIFCEILGYPGGSVHIPRGPLEHGIEATSLATVFGERLPDLRYEITAAPNTTVFFINGYNARRTSEPGELYIHSGSTVLGTGDDSGDRIVSISRLELPEFHS